MRAICTASGWIRLSGDSRKTFRIVDYAPITNKSLISKKKKQAESFVKLVDRMNGLIDELEKILKEGATSVENEVW